MDRMTRELVVFAIVVAVSVALVRVTQVVSPSLYFTTATLFASRREIRVYALLFRLAIPVVAGVTVALLLSQNEVLVACFAGFSTWLLLIWPVVWNPSLIEQEPRWPLYGLLLLFWGAYTILPVAGVAAESFVVDLGARHDVDWTRVLLEGVSNVAFSVVVVGAGTWLLSRRLTFAEDRLDEPVEEDWVYEPTARERFEARSSLINAGLAAAIILLLTAILIRLRGGRPGS
jgi:hypothetical protein